jgi:hypothetical protein
VSYIREVRIIPSYDHRTGSPSEKLGGGASGLRIAFFLVNEDRTAAIEWSLHTGFVKNPLAGSLNPYSGRREKPGIDESLRDLYPSAGGVVWHYSHPVEEYMESTAQSGCTLIASGVCYGDTGYLIGDSVMDALFDGGQEAVFARLEELIIR